MDVRALLGLGLSALAACSQGGGGSEPDRTAPAVGFTIPIDGATQVPIDTDVSVHFDEGEQSGRQSGEAKTALL